MEALNFQKKVKQFNELVEGIPKELNLVESDKKKFSLPNSKYFELPEIIKDRENKDEIIKYFSDKILLIMEKRREMEWKLPENLPPEKFEEIQIEIKELTEARKNENNFLGIGNVGCVYKTKYNEETCLKYLRTLNNPLLKNDLYQEYLIHERVYNVSDINHLTLKVPAPRHIVMNMDKVKSFFSMETVQGFSFKDIFFDSYNLLEMFNSDFSKLQILYEKITDPEFLKKLQEDLKLMHQESGVIHGDIHAGNIMLSKDMEIYLIDFGNSIDTNLAKVTDKDYEKVENVKDQDLLAVENLLKLLKKDLEKVLTKN